MDIRKLNWRKSGMPAFDENGVSVYACYADGRPGYRWVVFHGENVLCVWTCRISAVCRAKQQVRDLMASEESQ